MHGSLSQFKATLARKKERKDSQKGKFDRKKLSSKSSITKTEYDFPKLSETELGKVKKEIRNKLRSERKKELLILFLILILVCIILIYLN